MLLPPPHLLLAAAGHQDTQCGARCTSGCMAGSPAKSHLEPEASAAPHKPAGHHVTLPFKGNVQVGPGCLPACACLLSCHALHASAQASKCAPWPKARVEETWWVRPTHASHAVLHPRWIYPFLNAHKPYAWLAYLGLFGVHWAAFLAFAGLVQAKEWALRARGRRGGRRRRWGAWVPQLVAGKKRE